MLNSCFLAAAPLLVSDLPPYLPDSSHTIWHYQNQSLHVRGFWYPQEIGGGILASAPHLKSCCVGVPEKTGQVLVKGEISALSIDRAVTLTGIFKIDPLYNVEGKLIQLYVLESPQEVVSAFSWWPFMTIALSLLGMLFLFKREFAKPDRKPH